MDCQHVRNLEDINEILTLAKLNTNDVRPLAQTLRFTPENLHDNNYKLLQLDSHLLNDITEGNTLYIKGDDDDEVVICSETHTFHVTEAETSNSLLLVKHLKFNNEIEENEDPRINNILVSSIFYDYLEAVVGKPHLKKLHEILNKSVYKGPEVEFEVDQNSLLTFEELSNKVQASNKELKDALESMTVLELNNKIRLLDLEYHFRVLSLMLKLVEENSWQLDEIDFDETIEALKDLAPREVISSLFDKYTEESKLIDSLQLYRYKEDVVCTFFAKVLLHGTGRFELNEFLQTWKDSVPEGMICDEEMLYGLAVIDKTSDPNIIFAFDETSLPENINERFKTLFQVKTKWSVPEITPYIKQLATVKLDVNALLAKHARASKVDGIKYYSSKHGK
ncbi:unnamed protein product [Phaedon cochleariae]|uniref:Sister chromatid cohesion protein DCC1 n=1 Tax=Phaedon cochleariae TaxID=80249 RepID=A0A9N9SIM5_PHACE|nr:unnamed protein product [Phaedon cochleariae]